MSSPGSSSFATEEIVDRLLVMRDQEANSYAYTLYLPQIMAQESHLHISWREKISQWSYNVVDQ
jgi:hypothetical protein